MKKLYQYKSSANDSSTVSIKHSLSYETLGDFYYNSYYQGEAYKYNLFDNITYNTDRNNDLRRYVSYNTYSQLGLKFGLLLNIAALNYTKELKGKN